MSKNLYVIVEMEAFSDRPEVIFASTSKAKIDHKLEELKNSQREEDIFDYEEGDCLILQSDDWYCIEKVNEIL